MTQNTPPTMGLGMVRKRALHLLNRPKMIMTPAPHMTTLLLPTLVTPIAPMFSE